MQVKCDVPDEKLKKKRSVPPKAEHQPKNQPIKSRPPAEVTKESVGKTEVKEVVLQAKRAKPVTLPKIPDRKTNYTKTKKIISIRDIPADEIYIPLKGPEVDLEELIRKASPNVKRKVEKPEKSAASTSEDYVFISLHSPTESEKERERDREKDKETEKAEKSTFKQNFDDGIYIPLHSPPRSPNSAVSKTIIPTLDRKLVDSKKSTPVSKNKPKEPKKTKYEVCEDGSIFIPLHSPDEDSRPIRNFEDEIRRVDEELQAVKEMAEKGLLGEEKQKLSLLDLSDQTGNRQSLPMGRPGNYLTQTVQINI